MRTRRRPAAIAAMLTLSATAVALNLSTATAHAYEGGAVIEPTADVLAELRWCESGDDYWLDTGNGYYGAYQFSPETWWWLGYDGWPNEAPPEVQDEAAVVLWSIYGWDPWPGCAWWLGLY